jgi:hypothetical protein
MIASGCLENKTRCCANAQQRARRRPIRSAAFRRSALRHQRGPWPRHPRYGKPIGAVLDRACQRFARIRIRVDERIWLATFMHYDLGYFDDETCRLEPLENPFGPKVLPMSPV